MAEQPANHTRPNAAVNSSNVASSSDGPQENLLSIADLVTPALTKQYSNVRINTLFPWQSAALQLPDVLDGRSHLIYTASTSAGKTLVAEILLLRRLAEAGKGAKALFVLPLRALVAQKAASFAKLLEGTGLSSAAYYGGHGELPLPRKLNLCVCTIEKAQAIVQHMAEAGRLSEIVAVAFDEFHLLG